MIYDWINNPIWAFFTSCILYLFKHLKSFWPTCCFVKVPHFCSYNSFHFYSLHWSWYYWNNHFWLSHVAKVHLDWLVNLLWIGYTDQIKCCCVHVIPGFNLCEHVMWATSNTSVPSAFLNQDLYIVSPDGNWNIFSG